MLTQLRLAGKLDGIAGVLLGSFYDCKDEETTETVNEVLREMLGDLGVPVLANFPAGHGTDNWAFALGIAVRIDARARTVDILEPAVSP